MKKRSSKKKSDPRNAPALSKELSAHVGKLISNQPGKGWARLCELLRKAKEDPIIIESKPASDFLDLCLELSGDAFHAKDLDTAIEPLLQIIKSMHSSKSATSSHDGRSKTRQYAESAFMEHDGLWDSLGNAADTIKQAVIDESKKHTRPLSAINAQKTISEWLSKFVHKDASAWNKLTPEAQSRINRAKDRTRNTTR